MIQYEQPPVGKTFLFITGFMGAAWAVLLLGFSVCISLRVFTIVVQVCCAIIRCFFKEAWIIGVELTPHKGLIPSPST